MSRRNDASKLQLKLNLSPPRASRRIQSPTRSSSSSPSSTPTSCLSSEMNENNPNSPEATSMLLVGCPRCLMYVMLSENDPKCPKCHSTVLLDLVQGNSAKSKKLRSYD